MTTRKDFLISSGAAVALAPSAAGAAAKPAPSADGDIPQFVFDTAKFDAMIARDVKHRFSFAAEKLGGGEVCYAMTNVLDACDNALGEKPVSATSAAVLYHGSALALGFNDRVWNEMFAKALPKMSPSIRADLGDLKAGDGNQWLHEPKIGDYDASIDTLGKRGAVFFLCNNATTGFAQSLAKILGMTPAAAYAKLTSNLVPNAMLVPAGVWAIHALQEAHFTYQQVTL
jgi:intracellular sulfur oxidation DsrE/DsrF family protein